MLKDAFERTAEQWRMRYGQPYSLCGCMYNAPGTVKRLKSILKSDSDKPLKAKWRASKQLPGDAASDEQWQDATHPSSHNAFLLHDTLQRHEGIKQEMEHQWSTGKRRQGHSSAFV